MMSLGSQLGPDAWAPNGGQRGTGVPPLTKDKPVSQRLFLNRGGVSEISVLVRGNGRGTWNVISELGPVSEDVG